MTARSVLRSVFGYESFRGHQEAIVEHVLAGVGGGADFLDTALVVTAVVTMVAKWQAEDIYAKLRARVLRFVRGARDTGHSCIFIAHNIHHVFQVVDRMVVMRRGTVVADDLSPRTSSIQDVEDIITGEHAAA